MSKEPRRNVYVGHRYVPKIMGEWNNEQSYEGLSIVTHQGTSYTSKKHVPIGVDILDEEYWVVTGNYNAQVENYRQEVRNMGDYIDSEVNNLTNYVDGEVNNLTNYVNNALESKANQADLDETNQQLAQRVKKGELVLNVKDYGVVGDGVTDDTEAIQNIIDSLDNGGTLLFPEGVYAINFNKGINDRYGLVINKNNIKLVGQNAKFIRKTPLTELTNIPNDSYPIIFIGQPDSDNFYTENIEISGFEFEGQNIRHTSSGSALQDYRTFIMLRGTKNVTIKNNKFTKIDSSAIYCMMEGYVKTKIKNYDLLIKNNEFIAEPHNTQFRALLRAIVNNGVDNCSVIENTFHYCDAAVNGSTTYDNEHQKETDTYVDYDYGNGIVKRSGRNWLFDKNTVINSSEHGVYWFGVDVRITNNYFYVDDGENFINDIKVRAKGCLIKGNQIINGNAGITISEPSNNVTVIGNTIIRDADYTGGAIEVRSVDLFNYVEDRKDYLTHQPMKNIIITKNIIKSVLPVGSSHDYAFRFYTPASTSIPEYPNNTMDDVIISENIIENFNTVITFVRNNFGKNFSILDNIATGKEYNSKKEINGINDIDGNCFINSNYTTLLLSDLIVKGNKITWFKEIYGRYNDSSTATNRPVSRVFTENSLYKIGRLVDDEWYSTFGAQHVYANNLGVMLVNIDSFNVQYVGNNTFTDLEQDFNLYRRGKIQIVSQTDIRLYIDDNGNYIQLYNG